MGKDAEGFYQVEVTHADFAHSLFLKTSDKTDVEDWMQVLEDCRKATYSNAVLGSALLDRLKSAGTAMEKEKQQALEELQRQAEELEQARDLKWRTMMEHMQAQQAHDSAVNSQWGEQQKLQEEMDEIARNVEESRLAKLSEEQLAEEAKQQLEAAKVQLAELKHAVQLRQRDIDADPDVATDVARAMCTITKFFDESTAAA